MDFGENWWTFFLQASRSFLNPQGALGIRSDQGVTRPGFLPLDRTGGEPGQWEMFRKKWSLVISCVFLHVFWGSGGGGGRSLPLPPRGQTDWTDGHFHESIHESKQNQNVFIFAQKLAFAPLISGRRGSFFA